MQARGKKNAPSSPSFSVPDALQKGDPSTDLVFIVERQPLHFSKTLLTMCSPVFQALLTPDFVKQHSKGIPLEEEKKYNAVAFFFMQLHPVFSALAPITDDMLLDTLALAEEYKVDHLGTKCEAYMDNRLELCEARQALTADTILHYLNVCETYHLTKLRDRVAKLAAEKTTDSLQNSQFFEPVPATALKDVFLHRSRRLEKDLASLKKETKSELLTIAAQLSHTTTFDYSNSTLERSIEQIQSLIKAL